MWYDWTSERRRSEGAIVPNIPDALTLDRSQLACPIVPNVPIVGVTGQRGVLVP